MGRFTWFVCIGVLLLLVTPSIAAENRQPSVGNPPIPVITVDSLVAVPAGDSRWAVAFAGAMGRYLRGDGHILLQGAGYAAPISSGVLSDGLTTIGFMFGKKPKHTELPPELTEGDFVQGHRSTAAYQASDVVHYRCEATVEALSVPVKCNVGNGVDAGVNLHITVARADDGTVAYDDHLGRHNATCEGQDGSTQGTAFLDAQATHSIAYNADYVAKEVVRKLHNIFPLEASVLAGTAKKEFTIDIGTAVGAQKGMTFCAWRMGSGAIDPTTHAAIQTPPTEVGMVEIIEDALETSIVKVRKGDVQPGDRLVMSRLEQNWIARPLWGGRE